jgi:hypothetical protein
MDILAHTLWAGSGLLIWRGKKSTTSKTILLTTALAALPDLLHLLPVAVWSAFHDTSLLSLRQYVFASPDKQPVLPPLIALLAHHMHCIMHSALIAGAISLIICALFGSFWIPLVGWWSHIVIDVFTHSNDFYPSPVFYPVTMKGFNGIAWNEPWFVFVNYSVLAAVLIWISIEKMGRRDRLDKPDDVG